MIRIFTVLRLTVVWMTFLVPCSSAHEHNHESSNHTIDFIENKGQWVSEAKFKAEIPGGAVFLTEKGFVYNFVSLEDLNRRHDLTCGEHGYDDIDLSKETIRYHAYKVNFVNANSNVAYAAHSKRNHYQNYFIGNDPSKWAGKVALYGVVAGKNVYNGIDVKVYANGIQSIKYDLVVAPGADPGQIVLSFDGVSPSLTEEGHLRIRTTVNEVIEKAPYTYQEIEGRLMPVRSKYKLEKGRITFDFPEGYSTQHALVIDPDLVFATYSGGIGDANYAHTTAYDKEGNTYTGARSLGAGWPTTTGAYQTAFPSQTAAINKYNPDGSTLIFSTYFGGTSATCQPNTIRVNTDNEMYLSGCVTTATMPVTVGAYQTTINGSSDIYIARFSEDGSTLLASTYIGGSGIESSPMGTTIVYSELEPGTYSNPTDIALDNAGNIWVTSNSGSANFPTTSDASQAISGGGWDAVLFKMSPGLDRLLYSTYIGGRGWDGGIGIEYNPKNNTVGVVGYTASNNFPTTPGAYKTVAPGGVDGFALLMDNSAHQLLATTYLGTAGQDIAMRLSFDCANNFFVAGRTTGNYPITNTPAQGATNGFVFLDKLNSTLTSSIAATRTGGDGLAGVPNSGIVVSAMMVDICGNILVACIGESQRGVPLTADAFQVTASSFYFSVFEPNFSGLMFGSYFGPAQHYHPGVSRIDPRGVLYHSVCSNTEAFPITPRAYAPVKTNRALDNITFKFDFDAIFVSSSGQVNGGGANSTEKHCVRGCKPVALQYKIKPKQEPVTLKYLIEGDAVNEVDYQWIPDSIVIPANQANATIEIKGLLPSGASDPKHVIISMLAPCDCEGADNIISCDTVWIYDSLHVKILTPLDTVCSGTEITIEAEIAPSLNFIWSPAHLVPNVNALKIHPIPTITSVYNITVFQPGAPATCPPRTASYLVTVEPYPEITTPDIIACFGDSVDIVVSVAPEGIEYSYQWSPPDYLRNDHDVVNKFFALPGEYRKTIRASTPLANCTESDSFMITILPPFFEFDWLSPEDTTINYGDSIQLNSGSDAIKWSWTPVDYLNAATVQNPWARPLKSMIYTVTGFNQYGCKATANVKINVEYKSNSGVPNAFSPNGDGLNDVFRIEHLEFERLLEFKIFNRYGQLVFETRNPRQGWDGNYKGKSADAGVYYYRIVVALPPEGTVKVIKGDVSLIR